MSALDVAVRLALIAELPIAMDDETTLRARREIVTQAGTEGLTTYDATYHGASMTRSTVFKSNRSQAVRLPKPVTFPESVRQVDIVKLGRSRLISPVGKRWDDLFGNGPRASEDFMAERRQAPAGERKPL